jgi:group II intron reverse transcriptase/maturase
MEDKIVQQAVVDILTPIYEVDFSEYSYGFRPGRNCHDALDELYVSITNRKVSWVLDADIKSYFDSIDHDLLISVLKRRIADPRILRLVKKWLKAGVMEDGVWSNSEVGSPQGAAISPLLANIYLHYVLDEWVEDCCPTIEMSFF